MLTKTPGSKYYQNNFLRLVFLFSFNKPVTLVMTATRKALKPGLHY